MWSKIWKVVVFVGGLVGVAAQAKSTGASTAETIAITATAAVAAAGPMQSKPFGSNAGKAR